MPRQRLLRSLAFLRHNRCSILLAGLFVFILVHPLLAESAIGATFLALGTIGILLLGLWALRARRRTLLIVGVLALLTVHGIAADRLGEHWLMPATLLVTAAFMGAITAALLYYVLDWQPITTDKVFGAVAAYVLIAFTFACLFGLLRAGPAGCLPRCRGARARRPTRLGGDDVFLLHGADLDRLRRDHSGHQDGARPDRDRAGAGRDVCRIPHRAAGKSLRHPGASAGLTGGTPGPLPADALYGFRVTWRDQRANAASRRPPTERRAAIEGLTAGE